MIDTVELCHCGEPLHYTDPRTEEYVRRMVAVQGPTVKVVVENRAFMVPRHYIALHGLSGKDVADLGFEEVKP
jgi:hypothetical protein